MVLVAVACAQAPARAEVTSSGTDGFAMKIDLPVAAPPDRVFERFLEIGRWWSDEHTYSGHASNMTLRNEPGGCFCETLPNGGFIRHAAIEYSDPGKALYLSGALGPLLTLGAHGLLAVQFKAEGEGSRLVATYVVSGFPQGKGFAELAPLVDQVLLEQFTRLKRYVETGRPGA
ncbi:MAG: ATPase [Steroidobacteraceae bacterium]|nr:ATPase [Steroidobacteraceae bacterium]